MFENRYGVFIKEFGKEGNRLKTENIAPKRKWKKCFKTENALMRETWDSLNILKKKSGPQEPL